MTIQAFVDESGGKGHGRHFVMTGLISTANSWAAFSDEWQLCLDQSPTVRGVFKMRDAAGLSGAFRGWSEDMRDQKLRELARIINRRVAIYTFSAINLDAFGKVWEKLGWSPQNDPYFWPYHNTINASCFELWDRGLRERFEIMFDNNVILGTRAKIWYPFMREVMRFREPEVLSIMPIDPLFRSDDEFRPIQAADLFAWCMRSSFDVGGDAGFNWLLEELRDIQGTNYSQYYDDARMKDVARDAYGQSRDGLARYPELGDMYKEIKDKMYGKK